MGETLENLVTLQTGQSPHLKDHLQLKTEEGVRGRVTGETGNLYEDGKINVW